MPPPAPKCPKLTRMSVTVVITYGLDEKENMTLQVLGGHTVEEIKIHVSNETFIINASQPMRFKGERLEDNVTLWQAGVRDGSRLFFDLSESELL